MGGGSDRAPGLRALVAALWASGFGRRASAFGLRPSAFGLRASGFGLRASGFGLRRSLLRESPGVVALDAECDDF
ncbi:hypothetical protein C5C35_16370 [Rathayibacter sp. AY1F8]|nr:hypothetical protein C5C35_16370 [Rathayibacter sp. AY1F8]PPH85330.1 hypothetical protein C5C64_16580 [Rathayibacter sp. AY1D3]